MVYIATMFTVFGGSGGVEARAGRQWMGSVEVGDGEVAGGAFGFDFEFALVSPTSHSAHAAATS